MTIADAAVAATHERRQFLCHPLDGGRVLWIAVTFGQLFRWNGRTWIPFCPTLAQIASDGWKVSPRGPRTSAMRKRLALERR